MRTGIDVRPAEPADVGAVQRVSASTGQPPVESGADAGYVEFVMRTGTALVAADPDGRIVGWGAVRTHVLGSMLSDLFVSPDHQGLGIGRALLERLWPDDRSQPRFTFSSRHPVALPVYARAGLQSGWPLLYLSGPAPHETTLTARLVEAAVAADAEVGLVGAKRGPDYLFWRQTPGTSGVLVFDGTRLAACGAVRAGAVLHLSCPCRSDAGAALGAALGAAGARAVTVQLPGPHPAVPDLLRAGFRIDDYDIAMSTPRLDLPTAWAYSPGLG